MVVEGWRGTDCAEGEIQIMEPDCSSGLLTG